MNVSVCRSMEAWMDSMRYMDPFGHSALHSVNSKSLCDQCRQIFGCDSTTEVFQKQAFKTIGSWNDSCSMDKFDINLLPPDIRLVSFAYSLIQFIIWKSIPKYMTFFETI